MAINQNHLFEELNGVKCAIVEKNASQERVKFLKNLLEYNGYTVIVADTPAPKAAPAKAVPAKPATTAEGTEAAAPTPAATATPAPAAPTTFTVGVTDVTFNPINAVFGRLLRTPDGHVVTL